MVDIEEMKKMFAQKEAEMQTRVRKEITEQFKNSKPVAEDAAKKPRGRPKKTP